MQFNSFASLKRIGRSLALATAVLLGVETTSHAQCDCDPPPPRPPADVVTINGTDGKDKIRLGISKRRVDGEEITDYWSQVSTRDPEYINHGPDVVRFVVNGMGDRDKIFGTGVIARRDSGWLSGELNVPMEVDGGTGSDLIVGGEADDILRGNDDRDTIRGGEGNDYLFGGDGEDLLDGQSGNDCIFGGAAKDDLFGRGGDDTIFGGGGDDNIRGGPGDDTICGDGGGDFIRGAAGEDNLFGGTGNDIIHGGPNADDIHGGDDEDYVFGQSGADMVNGGGQNDLCSGGVGVDVVDGGGGDMDTCDDCPADGCARCEVANGKRAKLAGESDPVRAAYDPQTRILDLDADPIDWLTDSTNVQHLGDAGVCQDTLMGAQVRLSDPALLETDEDGRFLFEDIDIELTASEESVVTGVLTDVALDPENGMFGGTIREIEVINTVHSRFLALLETAVEQDVVISCWLLNPESTRELLNQTMNFSQVGAVEGASDLIGFHHDSDFGDRVVENCTNGVDDNEDGCLDCFDVDCVTTEICLEQPSIEIDLGNIVAGGDGFQSPPDGIIGVNGDTGAFENTRIGVEVTDTNSINPQPVNGLDGADESVFLDSVFILASDVGQRVSTSDVVFDFEAGDAGPAFELILSGREPGGADAIQFGRFGPYESGIGLHAAQGVTFDIRRLRERYGESNVRWISAIAGEARSNGAGGRANTYLLMASEDEIIDRRAFLKARDSAVFLQMEIVPEAEFIAFAVGAAGDGIVDDHGAFAEAMITEEARVDISTDFSEIIVDPPRLILRPGEEAQLTARGTISSPELMGVPMLLSFPDLIVETRDRNVAEIDGFGGVVGLENGDTTLLVSVGDLTTTIDVTVGEAIDLGDVTAGGDGTRKVQAKFIGIDPRNGRFVKTEFSGSLRESDPEGDGLDASPVVDSEFVDSVFILDSPGTPQQLTQSGVEFEFLEEDGFGSIWNHILADSNGGVLGRPITVGGRNRFRSAVGVHSAGGITYDLQALRDHHGVESLSRFSVFWGMDECEDGDVNLYAILSDDDGVIEARNLPGVTADEGELLELLVPPEARYLTLATGSNGEDACDHGTFAEARLFGGQLEPLFLRGDADAADSINLTDGIFVLNFLFLGGPEPPCLDAADANDDGSIDITAAVFVFNWLFLGGESPPLPGTTQCGPDPTKDVLGCREYANCPIEN